MRQPFWCFWAEGIMGEGAAFLLFAASKNHATSETAPLGQRIAQPSPSRLCRATSPKRERLWRGRKVYSLTADFFLSLNSKDETCRFCQGLSPSGELSPQATERVCPESNPLRHGYAVPPLPKGRGSGEGVKFMLYRSTFSGS